MHDDDDDDDDVSSSIICVCVFYSYIQLLVASVFNKFSVQGSYWVFMDLCDTVWNLQHPATRVLVGTLYSDMKTLFEKSVRIAYIFGCIHLQLSILLFNHLVIPALQYSTQVIFGKSPGGRCITSVWFLHWVDMISFLCYVMCITPCCTVYDHLFSTLI